MTLFEIIIEWYRNTREVKELKKCWKRQDKETWRLLKKKQQKSGGYIYEQPGWTIDLSGKYPKYVPPEDENAE